MNSRNDASGLRVRLNEQDRAMLSGASGDADRLAMSVIAQMADAVGAEELISVEQAHLDACALMSTSSLEFIEHIVNHAGHVRVPTTLNMVSVDLRNWRSLGVPGEFAEQASRIAQAYCQIGAVPTWTCAPYQSYLAPRFGQQVAWGESNAVAYANSVLGARTNRYGDYMDVCAAITGRVPKHGLHLFGNRRGEVLVRIRGVHPDVWKHTATWASLGHFLGRAVGSGIPVVDGLPHTVSSDQLKALGAAAASSGGIALFHIVGVTPEAPTAEAAFHGSEPEHIIDATPDILGCAWEELSSACAGDPVDAVVVGCPHYSYHEFESLVREVEAANGACVAPSVRFLLITSAPMHALAERSGWVDRLKAFGAILVHDTCPFHSPIVQKSARTIVTESGKCAYYAPGELDVNVSFGTIGDCVRSAIEGAVIKEELQWTA